MRALLSDRARALPLVAGLLMATIVGQGVAVGARIAADDGDGPRGGGHRTPGVLTGGISSDRARDDLCTQPSGAQPPSPKPGPNELPAPQREVADNVEELRGLAFEQPVRPEGVSQEEIGTRIQRSIRFSFPDERMRRRTQAWRAIGVIGPDADLAKQIREYSQGAIVGFYDTASKELVYAGSADPSPYERVTLAHELTHALDDQHFDLSRLDGLDASCADDALLAGIAIAEGSARFVEHLYISQKLTTEEYRQYQAESFAGGGTPPQLSPFFLNLLVFPYPYGEQYVQLIENSNGPDALNAAMRRLPPSTEQILHPERSKDAPQDVDVPDYATALGAGWTDLDVYDVGEAWLRLALMLRTDELQAAGAGQGWDGGEYRAWTNEAGRTAVAMRTVWDTPQDAAEFARVFKDWLGHTATGEVSKLARRGSTVTVFWAPTAAMVNAMAAARES
jgi:hypothetical protein